tara:strand:+ start:182 stop:787 length:606 start_codon:yes stop_codon:yes gene_type:complete
MKLIGLDFDNTLIDYDFLFYKTAFELDLIPHNIKKSKKAVREYLLKIGKEDFFTLIQGEVYGKSIQFAEQSEGVMDALMNLKLKGYEFVIVSHKTRFPIIGKKYDLHKSALNWLRKNSFMDTKGLNMKLENIHFLSTKLNKINKINSIKCDYFIDDLKEILEMIDCNVCRIHYNRNEETKYLNDNFYTFNNWKKLISLDIF